jgi:hypothetical protein
MHLNAGLDVVDRPVRRAVEAELDQRAQALGSRPAFCSRKSTKEAISAVLAAGREVSPGRYDMTGISCGTLTPG